MKNEAIVKELKQYESDSSWIHQHFDDLRERYPNEFVAVYQGEIIAHAQTIRALHAVMRKGHPETFGWAAVEYLPKEDLELIL